MNRQKKEGGKEENFYIQGGYHEWHRGCFQCVPQKKSTAFLLCTKQETTRGMARKRKEYGR